MKKGYILKNIVNFQTEIVGSRESTNLHWVFRWHQTHGYWQNYQRLAKMTKMSRNSVKCEQKQRYHSNVRKSLNLNNCLEKTKFKKIVLNPYSKLYGLSNDYQYELSPMNLSIGKIDWTKKNWFEYIVPTLTKVGRKNTYHKKLVKIFQGGRKINPHFLKLFRKTIVFFSVQLNAKIPLQAVDVKLTK